MRLRSIVFTGLLTSIFASPVAGRGFQEPSSRAVAPGADAIVPLVDYHAHINSLLYAQTNFPPVMPSVTLPPELARLLREFGKNWNSAAGMMPLFTDDSMMVKRDVNNWINGKKAAAGVWSMTFGEEVTLVPVAYHTDASVGYVMAYLGDTDPSPTLFGQTLISLKKEADGVWRIAGMMFDTGYPRAEKPVTAEDYLAELDRSGIPRGNILSVAFVFGGAAELEPGEGAKVRAENDWNAQQAARYPARLTAFCSFNPLKPYALIEAETCGKDPRIKGLKFHFASSGVNLKDPQHLAKLRAVFKVANRHRLAITSHIQRSSSDYDPKATATIFLNELLPLVPDVPVQIAHMAGESGFGAESQAAFDVFASAIEAKDPRTKNLYFDGSGPVDAGREQSPEMLAVVAAAMRRVGMGRILFASDRHAPNNPTPADAWKAWRDRLPITPAELRDIADNVVRYR